MRDNLETTQQRYKACSGYVVREIAGEYLLVPVEMRDDAEDQIAVINETGKFLWERLREWCSEEDLLQSITEEYQVSEEEALTDIRDFLNILKESKLLQESGGE